MSKLNITTGEFEVENVTTHNGDFYKVKTVDFASICNITTRDYVKARANAELIADAFNTANKTDMLPSELLVQRDDLLEMVEKLVTWYGNYEDNPNKFHPDKVLCKGENQQPLILMAMELINKCNEK